MFSYNAAHVVVQTKALILLLYEHDAIKVKRTKSRTKVG